MILILFDFEEKTNGWLKASRWNVTLRVFHNPNIRIHFANRNFLDPYSLANFFQNAMLKRQKIKT